MIITLKDQTSKFTREYDTEKDTMVVRYREGGAEEPVEVAYAWEEIVNRVKNCIDPNLNGIVDLNSEENLMEVMRNMKLHEKEIKKERKLLKKLMKQHKAYIERKKNEEKDREEGVVV
jgi:hypothetical protein